MSLAPQAPFCPIRHFKEPFYSKLLDKGNHALWEKKGRLTMEQRAAQVVDQILATHHCEPLAPEVQAKIKTIVQQEQDWIGGK